MPPGVSNKPQIVRPPAKTWRADKKAGSAVRAGTRRLGIRCCWSGARSRTRTGTALRPRDFKSLASTNFAIRATMRAKVPQGDGGADRNRTGVHGFAGRCVTTPPPRRGRFPAREGGIRARTLPQQETISPGERHAVCAVCALRHGPGNRGGYSVASASCEVRSPVGPHRPRSSRIQLARNQGFACLALACAHVAASLIAY